jgi:hypothetical protein
MHVVKPHCNTLSLILFCLLVQSCGNPVFDRMFGRNKKSDDVGPRVITLEPPAPGFHLADRHCQTAPIKNTLALYDQTSNNKLPCEGSCLPLNSSTAYYAGQTEAQKVPLQKTASSGSFFVDQTIKHTSHSWTTVTVGCKLVRDVLDCTDASYVENPAGVQLLRICEADSDFPRNTFESAAVTVSSAIEQAKSRFEQYTGKRINPIELRVNAIYYSDFKDPYGTTYRAYDVDNAFYNPKDQSISFLGQSQRMADMGAAPLYESPFVAVHEFAHHLQFSRFKDPIQKIGLKWNPIEHRFSSSPAYSDPYKDVSVVENFYSAVAESYADMMSYYLQDRDFKTELKAIKILSTLRYIFVPTFGPEAIPKAIDNRFMSCMQGGHERSECYSNNDDLRGYHNQGGVISSVLHQIFDATLQTDNTYDRIHPLDFYIETLVNQPRSYYLWSNERKGANTLFAPFKVAMIKTLNRFSSETPERKQKFCRLARELMPVLDFNDSQGWSCVDEAINNGFQRD